MKNYRGFTLIEIIIVLVLMLAVGGIAVRIFLSLTKGASRAESLKEVKQNGEYALSLMSQVIRNAKEVTNCQSNSITILNQDGFSTLFGISGDQIASNSHMLTSESLKAANLSFNCSGTGTATEKVQIKFTLEKTSTDPNEKIDQIWFETTVKLRKYF